MTSGDVRRLDDELAGRAAHREDPAYAALVESRFVNPEIAWTPEAVVHPGHAQDVQASVRWAVAHGLDVAVRGGGVGWVGAGEGTLLLDLRALDEISIDSTRPSVRAGAGALWRDVHLRLAPTGLAAAGPQFPRLSVAGYALGGGHGWLSGKVGWGCDTVLAVELVTADGQLVRASAEEHPELFWGLRGAGHNFGVAVAVELSLIRLESVHAGVIWFRPERTREVLEAYREWAPQMPDEVSSIVGISHPPGGAGRPGEHCAHVVLCHCGPASQAERDLAPLRALPGLMLDGVEEMPYVKLAAGNDVFAPGLHRRSRMRYLSGLPDPVADITAERFAGAHPLTMLGTHYYGGAMARVDEDATALSHRAEPWNYMIAMTWTDPEEGEALRVWQDDLLEALDPWSRDAVYVNYLCDEPDRVPSAYNPRTWDRLRALKQQWDPENRFSQNQNIPPEDRSSP